MRRTEQRTVLAVRAQFRPHFQSPWAYSSMHDMPPWPTGKCWWQNIQCVWNEIPLKCLLIAEKNIFQNIISQHLCSEVKYSNCSGRNFYTDGKIKEGKVYSGRGVLWLFCFFFPNCVCTSDYSWLKYFPYHLQSPLIFLQPHISLGFFIFIFYPYCFALNSPPNIYSMIIMRFSCEAAGDG